MAYIVCIQNEETDPIFSYLPFFEPTLNVWSDAAIEDSVQYGRENGKNIEHKPHLSKGILTTVNLWTQGVLRKILARFDLWQRIHAPVVSNTRCGVKSGKSNIFYYILYYCHNFTERSR